MMKKTGVAAAATCIGLLAVPGSIAAQESLFTLSEKDVVMVVDATGKTVGRALDESSSSVSLSKPEVYVGVVDGPRVFQLRLYLPDREHLVFAHFGLYFTTDDCTGTAYIPARMSDSDTATGLIRQAWADDRGDVFVPASDAPITITPQSTWRTNFSRYAIEHRLQHRFLILTRWTRFHPKRPSINLYDEFVPPFGLELRSDN